MEESDSKRVRVDGALNSLWKAVVAAHTDAAPKELKPLNIKDLCDRLGRGITKTAHDRYHLARVKQSKRKRSSSQKESSTSRVKRTRVS